MDPYFSEVLSDHEFDKSFKSSSIVGAIVDVFDGCYFVSRIG